MLSNNTTKISSTSRLSFSPALLKNAGFVFFLFFPFLDSNFLLTFDFLNTLQTLWKTLSVILIFILWILSYAKTKFSFIIILYYLWSGVCTIKGDGDLERWFKIALSAIFLCALCELCMNTSPKALLKALFYSFGFYVDFHFITLLLMNIGILKSGYWARSNISIFGNMNLAPSYILPFLIICILYARHYYHKTTFWVGLQIAICFLVYLLQHSATGLVGLLIVCGFWLFDRVISKNKIFKATHLFFIAIFLFVFIVILRKQEFFNSFIQSVLKKDITFTGRIYIWDIALETFILKNPIFGVGYQETDSLIVWSNVELGTHCDYLQIALNNGIVGLVIFLCAVFYALSKLSKEQSKHFSARILAAGIFAFLIMMITENYAGDKPLLVLLAIAANIQCMVKASTVVEPAVVKKTSSSKSFSTRKPKNAINL